MYYRVIAKSEEMTVEWAPYISVKEAETKVERLGAPYTQVIITDKEYNLIKVAR